MKIKTSELTDAALDWAVATITKAAIVSLDGTHLRDVKGRVYSPSTDWAQGGPIIEREGIDTLKLRFESGGWRAYHTPTHAAITHTYAEGPTPLIAAMRCYVASKLGDEVEVPDELFEGEKANENQNI